MLSSENIKVERICAVQAEIIKPAILNTGWSNNREWINFKRRARRNGYSLPKQVLVDAIKKEIKKNGVLRRNYDYVLDVKLEPCGGEAKYKTWDDIPNESVPCPCGDKTHWLIRYEEITDARR